MTDQEEARQELEQYDALDIIRAVYGSMNIQIKDPKKNCKRCYGRGWTGKHAGSGEPIPCTCILPAETFDKTGRIQYAVGRNRAERRARR